MASVILSQQTPSPHTVLQTAQRAPTILAKASTVSTTFPMSMLSTADTPELWTEIEQLLYACLRVGDDKSAFLCVERLSQRFGAENDRVMAMRGLYQEAVANSDEDLRKILEEYTKVLEENPMNVPIHKRRIALVKALGRQPQAISDLVDFLDAFPTDMEAWCELSDLYYSQGCISQAIFCLEEAIIITPNAWNLQARLGELEYMAASSSTDAEAQGHLKQAVQRFSRSIELCDDYLRGFYGLKIATDKLLQKISSKNNANPIISSEKLQKLNRLATSKLEAIIKDQLKPGRSGKDRPEVIAAQELLNRIKK